MHFVLFAAILSRLPPDAFYSGYDAAPPAASPRLKASDFFSGYDDGPAPAQRAANPLRRVLVYSPTWCSGCQQFERSTLNNGEFAFEFIHDEARFPGFVQDAISRGQVYPVVHFEPQPGKWRVMYGPASFGEFKTHWRDCVQRPTFNTAKPLQTVSHHGLFYGQYQSTYTWPGDLRHHLRSTHGVEPAGWNDAQCIAWHDNWHISHERHSRRG